MTSLLLDIDTQHKEMIHDAQLDYYAKKLATCSSDSTIKVYDLLGDQNFQHLSDLKGHDGPVWQIAWAHPMFGSILASCSFDGKVVMHREQPVGQWHKIFVYSDMKSSVNSLAWAPHEFDLCLACVTSDGKLAILSHNANDLWDATVLEVPNGLGLNAVSWAPFGAASSKRERRLVTGGCDHKLRIWVSCDDGVGNLASWKEDKVLSGAHVDWVRDVAWAPSIGLPSSVIASCSEDGKVVVWTQKKPGVEWEQDLVRDTKGTPVWRVSWSITGSVLAVSAGDSEVTLWKEAADGKNWIQVSNVNEETNEAFKINQQDEQPMQESYQQQQDPYIQRENERENGLGGQNQPSLVTQRQGYTQGSYEQHQQFQQQSVEQLQQEPQYRGVASNHFVQQSPPMQQSAPQAVQPQQYGKNNAPSDQYSQQATLSQQQYTQQTAPIQQYPAPQSPQYSQNDTLPEQYAQQPAPSLHQHAPQQFSAPPQSQQASAQPRQSSYMY